MTTTTLHLRFESRDHAFAELAPFGLVAAGLVPGETTFVSPAYPGGVRVDLALVGGDGTCRRRIGSTTLDDPDLGPLEIPVMETIPGFHLNLLWSDGTPPVFGAAVIDPETPRQIFAP